MKYPEDFINKIICRDNREILKFISNKSINCICTDPPYFLNPGGSCGGIAAKRQYVSEISDNNIDVGFDFSLLEEYKRVLINMNLITFCGKNELRGYLNWIYDNNYRFVLITWNKTNPTPLINNNYLPDTEYIFHVWDGHSVKLNGTYNTKKKYYITSVNKNIYEHPTVKPSQIVENLIQNASNSDDIVLDPFCGSGTTCVAAKKLGRNWIGIDNKQKYVDICNKRLREVDFNKSLFQ